MAQPTTKLELLREIATANEELESAIAALDEAAIIQPGAQEELSVKDIIGHIAWWERYAGDVLHAAARGEPLPWTQQPGEDPDAATDRVNAEVFAANRDRPLQEVLSELHAAHQHLLEEVSNLGEEQIFEPRKLFAGHDAPALGLIAANTFDHYPEHVAAMRAIAARSTSE